MFCSVGCLSFGIILRVKLKLYCVSIRCWKFSHLCLDSSSESIASCSFLGRLDFRRHVALSYKDVQMAVLFFLKVLSGLMSEYSLTLYVWPDLFFKTTFPNVFFGSDFSYPK